MALLRKPKPVSGREETPRTSSLAAAFTQSPLEVTQPWLPPHPNLGFPPAQPWLSPQPNLGSPPSPTLPRGHRGPRYAPAPSPASLFPFTRPFWKKLSLARNAAGSSRQQQRGYFKYRDHGEAWEGGERESRGKHGSANKKIKKSSRGVREEPGFLPLRKPRRFKTTRMLLPPAYGREALPVLRLWRELQRHHAPAAPPRRPPAPCVSGSSSRLVLARPGDASPAWRSSPEAGSQPGLQLSWPMLEKEERSAYLGV
ncbi:uncharacterized protein LOC141936881 [Strix uralensis]|uniref:uncharacterized protein LOC141936881 n=1 Tax=Strix uralensis TaxID=36305 RepID=UPI003DA736E0